MRMSLDIRVEPFCRAGVSEINDLNVIDEHQNRGIGRALIQEAEHLLAAAGRSVVGIGVGQSSDYAAAQHLYPKLGYVNGFTSCQFV